MSDSYAVKALAHPLRRDIIRHVALGISSPSDIAVGTGGDLCLVSYHVRMLVHYGVLEVEHTEPRRGALKHFYRFTDTAADDFAVARDVAALALKAAKRLRVAA